MRPIARKFNLNDYRAYNFDQIHYILNVTQKNIDNF